MSMLHDGPAGADTTIVLAHGAGAGMGSPAISAYAEGLAARGLRVVRFEFPYMERRRQTGKRGGPDRAPVLLDAWRRVIADRQADRQGSRLMIGGKSMGGRIASMVADECGVAGVVCLGYPFHPPGRPDKLRAEHLAKLRTPTLILQGERDPFGNAAEVAGYELSAAIRIHWIADGDHSFKPRTSSGRTMEQNIAEAIDAIVEFAGSLD